MHWIDWILLLAFFVAVVAVGLSFRKRASKDKESFFLGGRNLPWYIAGISMVATTFAADTPLAVTELTGMHGISGNWFWWNFLMGGMLTTFFFSRLWRRAGVVTEVELITLRYGGQQATFLRKFKAVYLGLFMNMLIIGWVNLAMMSLLEVFFDLNSGQAMAVTGIAMILVALYSGISGLLGVVYTDVMQFIIAMTGSIVLAWMTINSEAIGGMGALVKSMETLHPGALDFFPAIGQEGGAATLSIGLGAFFAYFGIQWWASWYPGAEPGGGGYVVQRMLSTKTERDSIFATLFFQVAHYCIRPWPWILTGLCAMLLYPQLAGENAHRLGYVMAMKDFLPDGFRGLMLAAFFGAYMSTISTQLNWGASYLVNDLAQNLSPQKEVLFSRLATFLLMAAGLGITLLMDSVSGVWKFIIECGAGLGLVLILRWYWWRINAWSEISATIAPFVFYALGNYGLKLDFPDSFFFTVGGTTITWLLVTFLTAPEPVSVLTNFYEKVRPGGWWGPVAKQVQKESKIESAGLLPLLICWISAVVFTYSILFFTGKLLFGFWYEALIFAGTGLFSLVLIIQFSRKARIFDA